MHPVIGECPICNDPLSVTRLHCRSCDSAIEGNFSLQRFHSLSEAQLSFAEVFIRCEGKLKRVEDELGISYPTVRARLHELIRAMGYSVSDASDEQAPVSAIDRQSILAELASGTINAEEAAQKLAGE